MPLHSVRHHYFLLKTYLVFPHLSSSIVLSWRECITIIGKTSSQLNWRHILWKGASVVPSHPPIPYHSPFTNLLSPRRWNSEMTEFHESHKFFCPTMCEIILTVSRKIHQQQEMSVQRKTTTSETNCGFTENEQITVVRRYSIKGIISSFNIPNAQDNFPDAQIEQNQSFFKENAFNGKLCRRFGEAAILPFSVESQTQTPCHSVQVRRCLCANTVHARRENNYWGIHCCHWTCSGRNISDSNIGG